MYATYALQYLCGSINKPTNNSKFNISRLCYVMLYYFRLEYYTHTHDIQYLCVCFLASSSRRRESFESDTYVVGVVVTLVVNNVN